MNAAIVQRFGALASTSHFIHPIPEGGLKRGSGESRRRFSHYGASRMR
jgi:hypothetical protein